MGDSQPVTDGLDRKHRQVVAARDAEILARTGPDPEMAGLAEHAVRIMLDRQEREFGDATQAAPDLD
jgi:hypothetical protein